MRAALIAVALVAAVADVADVAASPGQDLNEARTFFRAKDCAKAAGLLSLLLNPSEQLAQRSDLVEARSMLGACYFELGRREDAREEFERVLQLQPDKTLSELSYSAGAIRLFDDTKAEIEARAKRDAELKRIAEAREKLEAYRKSLVVYENRPYWVNFVPFGAGQFQEQRRGRGVLFAVGEGLTGGASAGIFLYLATKYGLVAKVPISEGPRIRQLQQIEIGTGVAFLGLYAWGVVDSLLHHTPRQQIQGDDSLVPRDLLDVDKPKPSPKTSLRDRIHFGPMITPSGVGIGIGWEN